MTLQHAAFYVNRTPWCIWSDDLARESRGFLEGIDTGYFEYILATQLAGEDLPTSDVTSDLPAELDLRVRRASALLRTTFHHSMEALFSFLGALVQAPFCPQAWISKCNTDDLRELVRRITEEDQRLHSSLKISSVSWRGIAEHFFDTTHLDSETKARHTHTFSVLWRRLALEFLSPGRIAEHNATKHGFGIRSGGIHLQVGEGDASETPPDQDSYLDLGGSRYGTIFYRAEAVDPANKHNRSLMTATYCNNWRIEEVTNLIRFASMSFHNVINHLLVLNGATRDDLHVVLLNEPAAAEIMADSPLSVHRIRFWPSNVAKVIPKISKRQIQEALR